MEIESKVGPLNKVEFFQYNPKGVCKIKFQSGLHAEDCTKLMNDRFFDGRKLKCYFWDGKTDYKKVQESNDVLQERVDKFGDWLEGQELPEEFQIKKEADVGSIAAKRDAKLQEKQEEKEGK